MKIGRVSLQTEQTILTGLIVFFGVILLRSTWLCDDAYITYRTVDNLAEGFGPVWNTDERVQGFTNPLWMLLLTFFYLFTKEIFFTSHLLQIALSLAAVILLAHKVALTRYHSLMLMTAVILSKAFVDFSSSGLENALIHFILAAFYTVYFGSVAPRRRLTLTLLASAGALTRMDTVLLFIPPIAHEVWGRFREAGRPALKRDLVHLGLGLLPFLIWELFALIYYGFPFPNTAYSKLGTGIPLGELAAQGIYYLFNSLNRDPLTLGITMLALVFAAVQRKPRHLAVAGGIVFYLIYVVRVGGDFMSGRFLSASFLAGVILLSRIVVQRERLYFGSISALMLILSGIVLFPTINGGYTERFKSARDSNGITDARRSGIREAGLIHTSRKHPLPRNKWITRGRRYRKERADYPVLGGVGYTGYYAGPEVHIIDIYGLTEPLLARFPTGKPVHEDTWRIGHFRRKLPEGYRKTLQTKQNVIADPNLAKYYDKLRLVVSGDLFSGARLLAVVKMNLGLYDHWLEAFVEAHPDLWLFPR